MPTKKSTPKSNAEVGARVRADLIERARVEIAQAILMADFYDLEVESLAEAGEGSDDAKRRSDYRLKAQQRRDTIAFNEKFLAYVRTRDEEASAS